MSFLSTCIKLCTYKYIAYKKVESAAYGGKSAAPKKNLGAAKGEDYIYGFGEIIFRFSFFFNRIQHRDFKPLSLFQDCRRHPVVPVQKQEFVSVFYGPYWFAAFLCLVVLHEV